VTSGKAGNIISLTFHGRLQFGSFQMTVTILIQNFEQLLREVNVLILLIWKDGLHKQHVQQPLHSNQPTTTIAQHNPKDNDVSNEGLAYGTG